MPKEIDWKQEMVCIDGKLYPCGTSVAMSLIGGKWKMVIIYHLMEGKLRYNELRKQLPTVTERTLSLQLKQLEADGFVKRTVYTRKPPLKVDYELTAFGKTLLPVLEAIGKWGEDLAKERGELVDLAGFKSR